MTTTTKQTDEDRSAIGTDHPSKVMLKEYRDLGLEVLGLLDELERLTTRATSAKSAAPKTINIEMPPDTKPEDEDGVIEKVIKARIKYEYGGIRVKDDRGRVRKFVDAKRSHKIADPTGDSATAIADLCNEITETVNRLIEQREQIENMIRVLSSADRRLIRFRYYACLPWPGVADKTGYSLRSVHNHHGRILGELDAAIGYKT